MKLVYANLIGTWCCLNDDPNCKIGSNHSSPDIWWKEEGQKMHDYNYINLHYLGKDYRIHPSFIQIITEKI